MIENLLHIDIVFFNLINQTLTNRIFDIFFRVITDLHKTWWVALPGIGVIFYFSVERFKSAAWRPILGLILALTISDAFSYRVLKHVVDRPRPFQNESLTNVRKLTDAHGNSFPSNHAANCFAAAFILAICFPRRWYLFYVFAGLVAYSRVYLGVHYPSDVLAGALVGLISGYMGAAFTVIQFKHFTPPEA